MANESIMSIAKDLTVAVLPRLAAPGSVEKYGQKIGQLYRVVLKEVEEGRKEILADRRHSAMFQTDESTELEVEEQ